MEKLRLHQGGGSTLAQLDYLIPEEYMGSCRPSLTIPKTDMEDARQVYKNCKYPKIFFDNFEDSSIASASLAQARSLR
jgi:predicted unusual protein kinase regulating ubiquinone biosynthesis (AarF/ABC1/UbiB family)